jgi:SAM-dependent methyltransferase
MPPPELWEAFFESDRVLEALGCGGLPGDVVEFGCGYGKFTIAAARRVSGIVYASDIDPLMVRATIDRVAQAGVRNVVVETRDFVADGCGRPDASVSFVMLFNILHIENPMSLLREAHRVLRNGGVAAVIHWRHDIQTPRGPSLEIRPSPAQCRSWAETAGLHWLSSPALPDSPWHWGMVLERPLVGSWFGCDDDEFPQ